LHGANRLASNSLLEALVFADRAARRATGAGHGENDGTECDVPSGRDSRPDAALVDEIRERVRELMWHQAGIVRNDVGIAAASSELALLENRLSAAPDYSSARWLETRNLVTVARLVVASARRRPESRGLHYNEDHPGLDGRLARDTVVSRRDIIDGPTQD
jgi:L-aspartate oxidase